MGAGKHKSHMASKVDKKKLQTRPTRIENRLHHVNNHDQIHHLIPFSTEIVPEVSDKKPGLLTTDSREDRALPSLDETLPIVEHYFRDINCIVPLFDQRSFMRMLHAYYDDPRNREAVTWSAIQTILAFGLRTSENGDSLDKISTQKAHAHLNNAKSVIPELLTRDEDLLGIQVLLGIVILLQNSSDQKPTSVVIASAMRLVHQLSLHSSESVLGITPEEQLQRCRIFWIAYILDKAISMRVKIPSIQSDSDISQQLPPTISPDGAGLIRTIDGRQEINYFRLRVELANIQGKIYDLLYSNRAASIEESERQQRIAHLQAKLDQWYQTITLPFQIEHVLSTVGANGLVRMTSLYHDYLMAQAMTNGLYSRDADWIKNPDSLTTITMDDIVVLQSHFGATKGNINQSPPSASAWDQLVWISRGCMKLFHAANEIECLVWQSSCGFSSSLIIILANISFYPSHPYVSLDQHFSTKSVDLLNKVLDLKYDKAYDATCKIVMELVKRADEAVEASILFQEPSSNNTLDLNSDWNTFPISDEAENFTFLDS